ncbi:MAG: diguanylate cyclase [Pseudomonadota bacterium]
MDAKKPRLLIVDDSRVIRVTARKILQDHFETIEAVDGVKAWDILADEEPVSLVVSDLTMPNLDGFGLLERIRSSHLPHIRDLPVIIITGSGDNDAIMERARKAGATDFIGKPFDSVHLLARTQAHASSHNITYALKQENTELEELSSIDQLTGLVNEASFMERAYQQLSYAIRHNNNLCIYRIEIDNYGDLYQKHGQEFSESTTRTIGDILINAIRIEDTAARIGPAHFALLLPGMEKSGIHTLAERINNEISKRTFKAGNERLALTLSIGVASPDIRRDTRLDELLAMADQRLSRAAAQGGNQIIHEDNDELPELKDLDLQQSVPLMELAGMIEQAMTVQADAPVSMPLFHDDNMDIEEIELFTPGIMDEPADLAGDMTAETQLPVECLSPSTAEPLSGSFAGPVPGNPAVGQSGDTISADTSVPEPAADGHDSASPTIPANDPGNVEDTIAGQGAPDEGIALSAPFSAHPGVNTIIDAANEPAATSEPVDASRKDTDLVASNDPLIHNHRIGLLESALTSLHTLFSWLRRSK